MNYSLWGFGMKQEMKGLIFEIIFLGVWLIVSIPLFVLKGNQYSLARLQFGGDNSFLHMEVVQSGNTTGLYPMSDEEAIYTLDGSVIKLTNLDSTPEICHFILKMNRIEHLEYYKIMFEGNISYLSDLEYTEDNDYYYFNLDTLEIANKDKYVTFLFWIANQENITSEDIVYSFMVERD